MKRYKMPDGTTRRFEDWDVPACAIPLEETLKKVEEVKEDAVETKAAPETKNKAIQPPKNKKGGAKK